MQTHWLTAAVAASLLVAEHSCHSMIQRASLGSRHQQYVHVRPHPASQTWQCLAVGPPSTAVGCAGGRVCGLCRGAGSVAVWGAGSVGCAGGPGLWAVRGAGSVGCAGGPGLWLCGGPGLWVVQGDRVCGLCGGPGLWVVQGDRVCGLCRGAGSVGCAGGPGIWGVSVGCAGGPGLWSVQGDQVIWSCFWLESLA